MPQEEEGTREDATRDARLLGRSLLAATSASDEVAAGRLGIVAAQGATGPRLNNSVDTGAGGRLDAGFIGCASLDLVAVAVSRHPVFPSDEGAARRLGLATTSRRATSPFYEGAAGRPHHDASPSSPRLTRGLESLLRRLMASGGVADLLTFGSASFSVPASSVAAGLESLLRGLIHAVDTASAAVWVERALRSLHTPAADACFQVFVGSRLVCLLAAANGPSGGIVLRIELVSPRGHMDYPLLIHDVSERSTFLQILDTEHKAPAPILHLPSDVLTIIFLLLPPKDALCLKLVCKQFCISTPKMIQKISSPMLLMVDQLCAKPFSMFSSELNTRFLLPYEFHGSEVKLFSTDADIVLLESGSQLFLLNISNGSMKVLPTPSEPFTSFILQVLASGSFQIQLVGLSSPSPFNLRFGYSDGGIWEEELLENNHPFEISALTGSVLIDDEMYCLGADGSIGHYGREEWAVIPSNEVIAFDVSDAYLCKTTNNSLSCILLGSSKVVALVFDLEQGMWQRLEALGGVCVATGTVQSFSVQEEPGKTIRLAYFRGLPVVRNASTSNFGSRLVFLVDGMEESCWRNNQSMLLQVEYPNSSLLKARQYNSAGESIWVKLRQVVVMSVV